MNGIDRSFILGYNLQSCAEEIAPVLQDLFQDSIDQSHLPTQWRKANICDKSQQENYPPVSLTSVVCKMLELIVHSHIMKHLSTANVASEPSGLRKHSSYRLSMISLQALRRTTQLSWQYSTSLRLLIKSHMKGS